MPELLTAYTETLSPKIPSQSLYTVETRSCFPHASPDAQSSPSLD